MVEWFIIFAIVGALFVVPFMIKISWNIAKGGTDFLALLGNAGKPGTVRQQSNNEINERKNRKNKKWGMDGKLK